MAVDEIRGIEIDGAEPKELVLSDGTRLCLESEAIERGRVEWRRCADGATSNADGAMGEAVSLRDALGLAGDRYSGYVEVRTRAEVEWMRTVSEWYHEQAELLSRELHAATA
jgi:hypothetical protein